MPKRGPVNYQTRERIVEQIENSDPAFDEQIDEDGDMVMVKKGSKSKKSTLMSDASYADNSKWQRKVANDLQFELERKQAAQEKAKKASKTLADLKINVKTAVSWLLYVNDIPEAGGIKAAAPKHKIDGGISTPDLIEFTESLPGSNVNGVSQAIAAVLNKIDLARIQREAGFIEDEQIAGQVTKEAQGG